MSAADSWDARYRATRSPFGDAPNGWLVECVERWRRERAALPTSALLLADGDGRNGAWLAAQPVDVTAVDASPVATGLAGRRDHAAGVTVRREVADLAQWKVRLGESFALAAVIYLQAEPGVRRRAIEQAAASLAPGGWLVVEAFASGGDAAHDVSLGPEGDDRRYSMEDLREWVAPLVPRICETRALALDEGPRHRGAAWVVRLLAEAP